MAFFLDCFLALILISCSLVFIHMINVGLKLRDWLMVGTALVAILGMGTLSMLYFL